MKELKPCPLCGGAGFCIGGHNDLISRCELFNRLATIAAPPEANDLKAEIYKVIQSMETVDAAPDKAVIIDRCGYCMGASFNDCEECERGRIYAAQNETMEG